MIYYFTAHTSNCVSHSIRSMFRVLGMYNFETTQNEDYKKKFTRSCPHHPLWGATKKAPCWKSSWECAETRRHWSNLLNDSCMPQNPCQWQQHGHGACQQIIHNLVTMYGLKWKEFEFSHRSYIRWPKPICLCFHAVKGISLEPT